MLGINKIKAFSLVEIMISLVIVSLIISAFAPVITKKLSASSVKVGGASLAGLSADCDNFFSNCIMCVGVKKCVLCKQGWYVNKDNTCSPCSDFNALTCTKEGATSCVATEGSAMFINDTDKKCKICPVGYKCDGYIKTLCSKGQYQDEEGKTACKPCDKGQYQDEEGKTSCKDCENKTYASTTGKVKCDDSTTVDNCKTYSKIADECSECNSTYYLKSKSNCALCDAGYYCSDGVNIIECSTNTYAEGGWIKCEDNTATNCATKSKVANKCATCATGYQFSGNSCVASSCSAGYYMKNGSCTICPAGSYCSGGTRTSVTGNCNGNCQYSLAGASGCSTVTSCGTSSSDTCVKAVTTHDRNECGTCLYQGQDCATVKAWGGYVYYKCGTGCCFSCYSDVRLKENIRKIAKVGKYNLYEFNYIGKENKEIGVIAQEMLEINSDVVTQRPDGYYMVNYCKLPIKVNRKIEKLMKKIK